jgi:predicted DNA binding CopG/RHH family protein
MRGGRTQKGVIAQELEKLLPSLVSEKEGWLPNVYKDGFTDVTGSIINLEGVSFDIVKGNILKVIILGSQSLSVKIKNVNLNIEKNTTDIEVEDKLQPLSDVFVYGSLDSYKMVDNTYLFMTSINAIKALASEIEHIKERLKTAGL